MLYICLRKNKVYLCIVRQLVSIFCIYIMALTIMPCTDSITCEESSSNHTSTHQHDHGDDESDTCSPFCVCACCGISGFVFESPKIYIQRVQKINSPELISSYNSQFHSSYFYSFWQPPKI
jgi:hypothetical protein